MSGNVHEQKPFTWVNENSFDNETNSQYSVEEEANVYIQRTPDIRQRVHDLFKFETYTDVKLVLSCGIKPKPSLLAHKAILASGSPVFAEMFYGNPSNQSQLPTASEYQINNVSFRAFSNVVEYLYSDDFYFENDSLVMEALAIAKRFQIQPLVSRCESYFESTEVSEDIVCSKLELAMSHKLESLKRRCIQFIEENTDTVLRCLDFKKSKITVVTAICKLQKLNLISEIELFDAIISWIEAQNTNSSKRELFQPFFKHIRFLTMTSEDFSRLVQRCPDIFTAEEALNMVMYLTSPDPMKLPTWCNKGTNRCVKRGACEVRVSNNYRERILSISLKKTSSGTARNLMCLLEMKCIRGRQLITALKLSFGEPVNSTSYIDSLIITVTVDNKYNFKEHIKIHNSTEVLVPFTHRLLASRGNTVYIRAEASEVKNYKFLQFDENISISRDNPFICNLGCIPSNEKLYFIKEVVYESMPNDRTSMKSGHQRGKRR